MIRALRNILSNQYLILEYLRKEHENDERFNDLNQWIDIREQHTEIAKDRLGFKNRFIKIKRKLKQMKE